MSTKVHLRHYCHPLLSIALWAILIQGAQAIPMKVTVGFDGLAKSFVWTPVAVDLENTSDDELQGTLTIGQPGSDAPYLSSCAAKVVLPAHSKKRYHTYARLASYGDVVVVFSRGGAVYGAQPLKVDARAESDVLVVSVGGRSTRLNFLNGEAFTRSPRYSPQYGGMTQPSQVAINVGSLAQSKLPDRPAAYEGVDLLILSDLDPAATRPDALKAIGMWVASGGTLVIPTGANFRGFQNEFYGDLLPVDITGAANIPGMGPLAPLGQSPFPAGAVSVSKSTLKPGIGREIASVGGVPLIAMRTYGAGTVVFLAFDHLGPPFKDWNGQTKFWKTILGTVAPDPMATPAVNPVELLNLQNQYRGNPYGMHQQGGMAGMVVRNPSVKVPSFNSIGLFLIAYLVALAPINYFVLKRRKRLELAWITTPAIVLLFTVCAYAIGYTMKGSDLRLRQATLIEGSSGARYAYALTDASLFSPARRSYDIEVDDTYSLGEAVPTKRSERLPSGYVDQSCTIERIPMAMWSSRSLESVSGADLGGTIESDLSLTGQTLTGQVRNNTKLDLTHCKVCYAGRAVKIADLPKGASANVSIAYTGKPPVQPSGVPVQPSPDTLGKDLYDFAQTEAMMAGDPVLVAETKTAPNQFRLVGQRHSSKSAACCVFGLDISVGTAAVVNPRSITVDVPNVGNAYNVSTTGYGTAKFEVNNSQPIEIEFSPQMPPGCAATSLVITHSSSGAPGMGQVEFSVLNRNNGKWVLVDGSDGSTVLDPSTCLGTENKVRVKTVLRGRGRVAVTLSLRAQGRMK